MKGAYWNETRILFFATLLLSVVSLLAGSLSTAIMALAMAVMLAVRLTRQDKKRS